MREAFCIGYINSDLKLFKAGLYSTDDLSFMPRTAVLQVTIHSVRAATYQAASDRLIEWLLHMHKYAPALRQAIELVDDRDFQEALKQQRENLATQQLENATKETNHENADTD